MESTLHKSSSGLILKLLSLLFLSRMFCDIPIAFKNVNWINFEIPLPLTKIFTFILFSFVFLFLVVGLRKTNRLTLNNIYVILIYLGFSVVLGFYNFYKLGMSLGGVFNILIRYLMQLMICLFVFRYIKYYKDLNILKNYLLIPAIFIITSISLLQIGTDSYYNVQGIDRLIGPFHNPNVLAPFLVLFVFMIIYFAVNKQLNKKYYMVAALLIIILFASGSLTSIIGLLIFFGLIFLKLKLYKNKIFYFTFPIVAIATLIFLFNNWESIINRISIVFNPSTFELSEASSVGWRIDAWTYYLGLFENPFQFIFGFGLGFQRFVFLNGFDGNLSYLFKAPGTHNDYLGILVDFGVIGFLFFFYFMSLLFRLINKSTVDKLSRAIVKSYVISVLVIMVMDNYLDGLITWVTLLFVLSIIRFHKNKEVVSSN